jgi:hypothetical protein
MSKWRSGPNTAGVKTPQKPVGSRHLRNRWGQDTSETGGVKTPGIRQRHDTSDQGGCGGTLRTRLGSTIA